jgi:DNA mismatch repair protein MutL
VRFKHQSFVHDAIRDAVLSALTQDKTIVPMGDDAAALSPFAPPPPQPRIPDSWISSDPIARDSFTLQPGMRTAGDEPIPLALNFRTVAATADGCEDAIEMPAYPEFDRIKTEVHPLGQLRDSFIVATDSSGLIVIDQHVAHERVLFEKYLREKLAGNLEVQRLLMPIVVQLPPKQLVILDSIVPELASNGFEVEPFGPKTIAIKTAPAILKPAVVEKLLLELLDGLERETQVMNIDALKKKIAATVSCHAAIKINMPLDDTKMRWLVSELMKTDVPTVCPHGRPIILRYDLREILKAFRRA